MKAGRKYIIDPAVDAHWRKKSEILSQKLKNDPDSAEAWFWAIQRDIIEYLLDRYCRGKNQSASSSLTGAPLGSIDAPSYNPIEITPSASAATSDRDGKSPRASGAIGPVLQSIARLNRDRYEVIQRFEEELSAAFQIERNEIRILVSDLAKKYPPGGIYKPFENAQVSAPALSDDQFAKILSGVIDLELPFAEVREQPKKKE